MTISMFDSFAERAIVIRTQNIIDMSQATTYAQAAKEGRRDMFNSWTRTIGQVTTSILQKVHHNSGRSVITWNGVPMGRHELVKQFRQVFGKKSTVSK